MKNDGGSAFPFSATDRLGSVDELGMSLRDYFAAKAMQGDWAAQNDCVPKRYKAIFVGSFDNVSEFSKSAKQYYMMADAMIAERDK